MKYYVVIKGVKGSEILKKNLDRQVAIEAIDLAKKMGSSGVETIVKNSKNEEIWSSNKIKEDFSGICTYNDDKDPNCWHCIYFLFPLGCMKWD